MTRKAPKGKPSSPHDRSRSSKLEASLTSFIADALVVLKQVATRYPIPTRTALKIRRQDDTSGEYTHIQVPDAHFLTMLAFEEIANLDATLSFHRQVSESPIGERVLVDGQNFIDDPYEQKQLLLNLYLIPLLVRYVGPELRLELDSKIVHEVFECLDRNFATGEVPYIAIAPLPGFAGPDSIVLDEAIRIRRITEEEFAFLWQSSTFPGASFGGIDEFELMRTRFCVAVNYGSHRGDTFGTPPVNEDIERAILALRLVKAGQVFAAGVYHQPTVVHLGPPHPPTRMWHYHRGIGEPLLLEESDVEELRRLYALLSREKQTDVWALAAGRFGLAYERMRLPDRLIDYWISLESLFLPDESLELKYKAGMRIAWFIGMDPDDRSEVFEKLQRSYKRRSDTVHGTAPKKDLDELTNYTEDVVRRALKRIVSSEDIVTAKTFVSSLDRMISRGGADDDPAI